MTTKRPGEMWLWKWYTGLQVFELKNVAGLLVQINKIFLKVVYRSLCIWVETYNILLNQINKTCTHVWIDWDAVAIIQTLVHTFRSIVSIITQFVQCIELKCQPKNITKTLMTPGLLGSMGQFRSSGYRNYELNDAVTSSDVSWGMHFVIFRWKTSKKHEHMGRKMKSVAKMGRKVGKSINI